MRSGATDDDLIPARIRSLHRSPVLSDFAAELGGTRNDEEKHSSGRKFARSLEAWSEVHRQVTSFDILREDAPPPHSRPGPEEVVAAFAGHWAPGFNAGADISDVAADRLLWHCIALPLVAAIRPLELDEFAAVIGHTHIFEPGPDGLPHSVWTATGDLGVRILHRAYLALLTGVPPPFEFNRSLAVYIPKGLDHSRQGLRRLCRVRPAPSPCRTPRTS